MKVSTLNVAINNAYYDIGLMDHLEQHLGYIKDQGLTLVTIKETVAYKHEGNFYGILHELNIPANLHYITMRINDLLNSGDYDGYDTTIKLPEYGIIEQLKAQYLTLKN